MLSFSLAGVRPFAFPSSISFTWLLVGSVFRESSSPPFYFVFCALMFRWGRYGHFARFLSPFAHLLFLLSVCFALQTPGLCGAFSLAPFSLAHVLFVIWVSCASQTPGLCCASILGSPLPSTCFICLCSVLRLAIFGFVWCLSLQFASHFCTRLFLCRCAQGRSQDFSKGGSHCVKVRVLSRLSCRPPRRVSA